MLASLAFASAVFCAAVVLAWALRSPGWRLVRRLLRLRAETRALLLCIAILAALAAL